MCFWTPLFIAAYKLSWIDWSLWWICLTLIFDAKGPQIINIKKDRFNG